MNLQISKKAVAAVMMFAVGAVMAPAMFAQEEATYSLGEKILGIPGGPFGIITQLAIILVSVFMFGWIIECFV
ncbi:MAG: hypothetical protein KDB82_04745, partial [Planctomycetes bacterium]|nr:hypothetical protein [Planctomycetota bacterium]